MRFLDIPISQPAFFDPQSAWLRHGPFAMWLVGALRPRRIVELGTHSGYSYFAFCQAVQQHGLWTDCIAIDTWQGDEHAGFYGDEVYDAVVARNTPYVGFSTLLRKTFAEALEDVEDGSIDLLHVDGRHFYDDVKTDFESWIPKLSPRAVVLFHDTEVRERGFGVYKYWNQIASTRPSLNFPHQNGLGVLFWGSEVAEDIRRLLDFLDHDGGHEACVASFVLAGEDSVRRQVFDHIGDVAPEHLPLLKADYEAQLTRARANHDLLSEKISGLTQALAKANEEKTALELCLADAREADARQRHRIVEMDGWLCKARRRPWKLVGALWAFRVLDWLSRATPPLPAKTTERFARSARKRDPRISPVPFSDLPWVAKDSDLIAPRPSLEDLRKQVRTSSEGQLRQFLASNEEILFSTFDKPRITIILVVWNQAPLTLACLRSLTKDVSVSFDVVIVDNASSDATAELLARVHGARILSPDSNLGFLRAVNVALTEVRAGHVLLLNNDATLRRGTLASALTAMDSGNDIGAVGGPIVLPDGTLQEAGSIIWRDGSCEGYGRGDDPDCGSYMFRREVDYCSGAFLLIREGLFQRLDGFDEAYVPAYYEETDLCMRIRAAGYRVIYEPGAIIDHFEFGSSEKVGSVLELQSHNRNVFRNRHADALAHHLPAGQSNVLAARMRGDRPRVLYIEDRVPLPDVGAGLPRANTILRVMAEAGLFITFLPAITPYETWSATFGVVPEGVEVAMGIGLDGLESFLREREGYYACIFVSRPHNMKRLAEIDRRFPALFESVRIVYDAEAIFASRDVSKAELLGDATLRKHALASERVELALAAPAHHVIAVNEAEAERFRSLGGPSVSVLGHALPIAPTPASFENRKHVLFLGSLVDEESPNVDSFVWFVDAVMPHLNTLFDGPTCFLVAGRNDADSVRARSDKRISLLGPVADLAGVFDRARVFVAPTRFAAGIPHKVHQAAALGVPVVATGLLARQLGWEDGLHLLVADTPEDFADAVSRLFNDANLWLAIRTAALQKVAQDCSIDEFRDTLLHVVKPC